MKTTDSPELGARTAGLAAALALGTACTTLGPMPATTAQSPTPVERPGVGLQAGLLPGFFLSSSVQDDPKGTPVNQGAIMIEPGELIGLPGLAVGGRYVGKSDQGGYPEPMLRYRLYLEPEKRASLAAVAFGTRASGEDSGASYEATRGGAELLFDYRVTEQSKWLEIHFFGGGQLTGLWAEGEYCLDADGRFGRDCPEAPAPPAARASAEASGFYPAASGGVAFELGRHLSGVLHGGRVGLHAAFGTMPRLERGEQQTARAYGALGFSLMLGLGGAE